MRLVAKPSSGNSVECSSLDLLEDIETMGVVARPPSTGQSFGGHRISSEWYLMLLYQVRKLKSGCGEEKAELFYQDNGAALKTDSNLSWLDSSGE
ncbi:unnamed protein product [Taenia asiatica]|uniref:Uncharacterized protein n=1 Tax=Taenia asiatica TaxID=60517 RepID=A0A0R3WBM9_TAEAS|nr:unnamed protein product [Taenia asiatica]